MSKGLAKNYGFVVAETEEAAKAKAIEKFPELAGKKFSLRQDEDCLDTWFSSWLWPISVFDGIRNPDNADIKYYYPTDDLVTGPDILFFWVARMIMAGYEYRGREPFGNVYLTGMVRDKLGRKMSKSLGNSPDPLGLIEKYGADGVRLGMLFTSPAGNDLPYDDSLCEQGRNFGNKIWNAWKLVASWNVDPALAQSENNRLAVEWFGAAFDRALAEIEQHFAAYRISDALMTAYKLFWDDFSAWYLEMVKPAYQAPIDAATLQQTKDIFERLMLVLHPFMPFLTEEIWQQLAPRKEGESICISAMPVAGKADETLLAQMAVAQEAITAVRNIRKEKKIPSREAVALQVMADENYPARLEPLLTKMAGLSSLERVTEKPAGAAAFMVKTTQYFVLLEHKADAGAEKAKLQAELDYYEGFLRSVEAKLSNERFTGSAPAKVVENERAKQSDTLAKIEAIRVRLAEL